MTSTVPDTTAGPCGDRIRELADKLDYFALHAKWRAEDYEPDTPERITHVAQMRAYAYAARTVRGDAPTSTRPTFAAALDDREVPTLRP